MSVDKEKLQEDNDYVFSPRFNNSLKNLMKRFPDGVADKTAACALGLTEVELNNEYEKILSILKSALK
jgi:hypothetical protein